MNVRRRDHQKFGGLELKQALNTMLTYQKIKLIMNSSFRVLGNWS